MNCLVVIKTSNSVTKTNGGLPISSMVLLTTDEYHNLKSQISLDDKEIIPANDELHEMFGERKRFRMSFISRLMEMSKDEIMKLISAYDNISDYNGNTISHLVINHDFCMFTFDELLKLKNPSNSSGKTVAHEMALKGFRFSAEELIRLGNPGDNSGETIAHWMIMAQNPLTVDEILKIGDPKTNGGSSVSYWMVKHGYNFSVDEIIQLGNPKNFHGNTLSETLEMRGYVFSIDEKFRLKMP